MAMKSQNLNDIVLSYYDCLLRITDIELLKGPHWLNDVIIGFYFEYLDHKFNRNDKKELLFISPEVTQLLKMTDPSHYSVFLDPIGMPECKFIFLPLNNCDRKDAAGGSHWSLIVVCQKEKVCYHFDSSKGFNNDIALEFTKNLMCYMFGNDINFQKQMFVGNKFIEPECPQQSNGYDCGIYVLCMTDVILEHLLKSNKIDGCNYDEVRKLAQSKRLELLKLVYELQSVSNAFQ